MALQGGPESSWAGAGHVIAGAGSFSGDVCGGQGELGKYACSRGQWQ